jgi:hypothetical protein
MSKPFQQQRSKAAAEGLVCHFPKAPRRDKEAR